MTLESLFNKFGGPSGVGRVIGKSTEHAAAMRRRGSIPVEYWPNLVSYAESHGLDGVTYEALVLMHTRFRTPEPAREVAG